MSMYFQLKLVMNPEYMKILKMVLPNYRKINVECITKEAQNIETADRKSVDTFFMSMCVYVGGLIEVTWSILNFVY